MTVLDWMASHGVRAQCYLGDGVYAACDDYQQLWLLVDRDGEIHNVALDNSTFNNLLQYRDKVERLASTAKSFEDVPEQL